jgi:phage replication-related protein YjqB (UPF0714/DUF867 family)
LGAIPEEANLSEIPDLTLMPEVHARAALAGRAVRFSVLAPVGGWLGHGTLRVLRTIERDGTIELVCGYDSYERYEG